MKAKTQNAVKRSSNRNNNHNAYINNNNFRLLTRVRLQHSLVQLHSHVDDISQLCHAPSEDALRARLVSAGSDLANSLSELGFTISSKSVVVTPRRSLSESISSNLLLRTNVAVSPHVSCPDLGADFGAGARRVVKHSLERFDNASARRRRVPRLVRVNRKSSKLYTTGTSPSIDYMCETMGVSPARLAVAQRACGAASACVAAGRCCATAIAITFDIDVDPFVKLPLRTFVRTHVCVGVDYFADAHKHGLAVEVSSPRQRDLLRLVYAKGNAPLACSDAVEPHACTQTHAHKHIRTQPRSMRLVHTRHTHNVWVSAFGPMPAFGRCPGHLNWGAPALDYILRTPIIIECLS